MLHVPARFASILIAFAPVFVQARTWQHAQMLLLGALLVPGQRTVCSILRIIGLGQERHFVTWHRVLNRAVWNSRLAARVLLGLLVKTFAPNGPVLLGVDDSIERRRGKRISAKGIYRDPVRSSRSFFVKTSGLRWLSLMLLSPMPWAGRVWALPFLTVLAPSQRYCEARGLRHKTLTDWARQVVLQARRWLPGREIVLLGDSSFAVLDLLVALIRHGVISVTRLRLDAALYKPAPSRQPGTKGRSRKKGDRLPSLAQVLTDASTSWQSITVSNWYGTPERCLEFCSQTAVWFHSGHTPLPIRWVLLRDPLGQFEPQALLCTDLMKDPLCIIGWFVQRWSRSPSARCVITSALRASGSGPTRPSPAPRPVCSACSPWSRCSPLSLRRAPAVRFGRQPGMANNSRPLPIRWPPSAARSGRRRVSRSPANSQTCKNSPSACAMA